MGKRYQKKQRGFIGKSVLKKTKSVLPDEAELTIKPPYPLSFVTLKLKWEKKYQKKLTNEEFEKVLQIYLSEKIKNESKRQKQKKYPKETIII